MFSRDERSSLFFCFLVSFCFLSNVILSSVSLLLFVLFYFILFYFSIIVPPPQVPIRDRQDRHPCHACNNRSTMLRVVFRYRCYRYPPISFRPSIVSSSPWLVVASIRTRDRDHSCFIFFLFFPPPETIDLRSRKEKRGKNERGKRQREGEVGNIDEENKLSIINSDLFFYIKKETRRILKRDQETTRKNR